MTITATAPESLHQWNGHPVPWVTRWDGEVSKEPLAIAMTREGLVVEYKDRLENRESSGLLWKREGLTRRGVPQFSEMNTYRQRAAMNKRLCQICGSKIDERPIRWLMSREQLNMGEEGALTISPPTCSACIPLALELCPHLKTNPWVILKVLDYEVWGVFGEAVHLAPEDGKIRDLRGVFVSYEKPAIPLQAVIAFQQVVKLTKFVVEEEGGME